MKSTFGINPRAAVWLLFATGAVILALTGCDSKTKSGFDISDDTKEVQLAPPEPLKLLAIGVPGFDEEVSRQWSAQRDGDLKISHLDIDEFESNNGLSEDADLIVHPASINVDLISNDLIRPYPREGLLSDEMNFDGFLLHFRKALVRHNDKTWAVSLGGQQLRLLYRRDILDAAGIQPPETWEDLDRAIEKLKDVEEAKGMKSIIIPTAGEMASKMFAARAASQIRDRGKLTSFFDRRTMKPTIDSPPFERALTSLKSLASETGGVYSVSEVFEKFAAGECVFAIAWPTVTQNVDADKLELESANWGIERLPGSLTFYDLKGANWQKRNRDDDFKIDLLDASANNISIAAGTAKSKDATEFVAWLTDKQNSNKLLLDVAAPFRATHLGRIGKWYSIEQADRKFLDALADSIDETHESRIFLMFPQLPGKRRYLKLLDESVAKFLADDDADVKKVLESVAQEWETLTESLGRDPQIEELRQGNGI